MPIKPRRNQSTEPSTDNSVVGKHPPVLFLWETIWGTAYRRGPPTPWYHRTTRRLRSIGAIHQLWPNPPNHFIVYRHFILQLVVSKRRSSEEFCLLLVIFLKEKSRNINQNPAPFPTNCSDNRSRDKVDRPLSYAYTKVTAVVDQKIFSLLKRFEYRL